MSISDVKDWSKTEKQIAQAAFNKAYEREARHLIEEVREQSSAIADLNDVWRLNDALNARRHDIDGKYDYRYSVLIFVFAQLLREGWLHLDELKGLEADKLAKICALTRL
jgi:hypothetical protein